MVKTSSTHRTPNVTHIKASDAAKKSAPIPKIKPAIDSKRHEQVRKAAARKRKGRHNPLAPVGRYFKGAWQELKLVRWPDRRSTWGMTGALLLFTLFFIVVILLLDYGFAQLFKLILGSN